MKKPFLNSLILVFLLVFLNDTSWSQNLEKIGKKDMVKVNGGLSFNTITYYSQGIDFPSREPFTWYASGNVNVSILDVSLPFTYTYSNQGGKFTQPFNRTSLNPSYKWVKTSIGLTCTNFSSYTLSGYLFLGAVVDLTPGKWKISAMAGRLNKAVEFDAIEDNYNEIVYRRFGYGVKCGYDNKGYGGSIILFKAKDNENSLPFVPINTTVQPQDNLVLSAAGKASFLKYFRLEAEYAVSFLTQNTQFANESASNNFLDKVISGNESTSIYYAFKSSFKYQIKWMSVGFNFEHIDPGYKTLGGYYFNNDLNNYTISPSFNLFKQKLTISGNTGIQKNNLAGDKSATTTRWVGSINCGFVPNQSIILNANYSNFSTFTKNRPVSDPFYFAPADTLNFYQLTQSAGALATYSFGKSENKNRLQLTYNFQTSQSLSGNINEVGAFGVTSEPITSDQTMNVHLTNVAYNKSIKAWAASFTFAANVNYTITSFQNNLFIGPTLAFQKSLFSKKSSLSIGSTYNKQYTGEVLSANVLNQRISFTYAPKLANEKAGKINLSANANWMTKLPTAATTSNSNELNLFINLNYSF